MFVGIVNTPRDYAWGSAGAISELMGHVSSGRPEAELWLGAHAGSPSVIVDPAQVGGCGTLAEWVARDPESALGAERAASTAANGGVRLPFLLKVLAAAQPLSLQAHPSSARALAAFARENAAGIPINAPERNYRDPFHKPELIFALSDTFEALCGFRNIADIHRILAELRALDMASPDPQAAALDALENRLVGAAGLHDVVEWLLRDGRGGDSGEVSWLIERVVALAEHAVYLAEGGAVVSYARELETVRTLAESYPGDPGIVISLLLNRVTLKRGEVLYLPAGNIHAYLSGLGIELMAASDNVLRGGLTPKHIDVDELLAVLDFTSIPVPYLAPADDSSPGVSVFRPGVADFELVHIWADATDVADATDATDATDVAGAASGSIAGGVPMRQVTLPGPGIALCTSGGFLVAGAQTSVRVKRGEAVYITPDEGTLTFAGAGEVFLATTGS